MQELIKVAHEIRKSCRIKINKDSLKQALKVAKTHPIY